jgi:hypothetical protein
MSHGYEHGLDRGVFYSGSGWGESWNGLISIVEETNVSDSIRYLDGVKIPASSNYGYFSGTIEAFTYPDSFAEYDGTSQNFIHQQKRKSFSLCYRIKTKDSYKIHLIYNAKVTPTKRAHEQLDASVFSWAFTTQAVQIPDGYIGSHLIIEVDDAYPNAIKDLEDVLYGSDINNSRIPSPTELMEIFETYALLKVTKNSDGTFTVKGPNEAITMLDSTTFEITWHSAIYINDVTYRISSG